MLFIKLLLRFNIIKINILSSSSSSLSSLLLLLYHYA